MKVYKILHKPTGLYFTPSKGYGNLSTTGKLYPKKPNLNWVKDGVRIIMKKWFGDKISKKDEILINYFNLKERPGSAFVNCLFYIDDNFNVPITDWEIIEL